MCTSCACSETIIINTIVQRITVRGDSCNWTSPCLGTTLTMVVSLQNLPSIHHSPGMLCPSPRVNEAGGRASYQQNDHKALQRSQRKIQYIGYTKAPARLMQQWQRIWDRGGEGGLGGHKGFGSRGPGSTHQWPSAHHLAKVRSFLHLESPDCSCNVTLWTALPVFVGVVW